MSWPLDRLADIEPTLFANAILRSGAMPRSDHAGGHAPVHVEYDLLGQSPELVSGRDRDFPFFRPKVVIDERVNQMACKRKFAPPFAIFTRLDGVCVIQIGIARIR